MRSVRSISTTRDSSVRPNIRNATAGSTASRWHTDVSCRVPPIPLASCSRSSEHRCRRRGSCSAVAVNAPPSTIAIVSEPVPARHAVTMRKFAPAFPVSALAASLAHYARLGFTTSEYTGDSAAGGYGFARRDGVELQLGTVSSGRTATPTTAYLYVDDADALAAEWRETAADVRPPED